MWQIGRPFFSRYRWWYSSARQNVDAAVISVTMGREKRFDACNFAFDARAAASCSGE